MRTLTRLIAPAALAGVLALAASAPLLALDAPPAGDVPPIAAQEAEASRDVVPPLIWSFVGVGLFCGALGVLYLLKRELGGFAPRPGAWTAPISVIESQTLAVEESDYPEPEDDGHGH
jgi:H+/Cl- antiporter ClcA